MQWNAVARDELLIGPESIATITAISHRAPQEESLYLEGIVQGSDAFTQVPNGVITMNDECCFQVKIANTTNQSLIVRAGELVGRLYKAEEILKACKGMTSQELNEFVKQAICLATLVPRMDSWVKPPLAEPSHSAEADPQDTEHLGWGPKTMDPGPDQIYPSNQLKEVVNVDSLLEPAQREALFEVVK